MSDCPAGNAPGVTVKVNRVLLPGNTFVLVVAAFAGAVAWLNTPLALVPVVAETPAMAALPKSTVRGVIAVKTSATSSFNAGLTVEVARLTML